ncbi:MAG: hypothetical protein FJX72_15860, partial [Armatimonadetes bacterium]|nr:hypothetical protein [Armatimonadota bacterium]
MRLGNRCGSAAIVGQAVACVLALSIVGCGGGGGSTSTFRGRSFTEVAAERAFYMSVDGAGRFTLAFRLAASPTWVAAQGSIGPTSQFSAQSPDGLTQFEGTATAGGDAITYTVKQSGTTIVTATAAQVAAGTATPASLVGSFMRRPGVEIAYLTADAAGHATLWLDTGAASGAALVTVAPDGVIGDAGGNTVGRLDASGSDVGLTLTKLNGSPVSVALTLTRVTRAKWTFLVFMNAANDLQEFGPLNFGQMEKIGSSADVNIVVQWKQADCAGCGSPDWVSTRRYYVTRDQHSQLVEDLGPNVDMGDWRELASFIRWTQQRYPADHYALVIWDHGAGWRSTRGAAAAVRSVSIDDDTGNEIQTWELPQALNVSPKVDLLVFDASLMQMMEVAYEVRP